MAHFAKYGKAATGHMTKHYERAKEWNAVTGEMEYIKFNNQDIDPTRTHLNYNLAPERPQGQIAFIKQRMSEIKCQNRADVNVMCSCIVTLPKVMDEEKSEWKEKPDGSYELQPIYKEFSEDEEREFFRTVYSKLCAKFGENNVISAYVHMDETQPHIHFAFVPAVEDRKWNAKHPDQPREKLSAKECVSRSMLREFHKELQSALDDKFGRDYFPVLNGATERGNLSVLELKAQRDIQDIGFEISVLESQQMHSRIDLESLQRKLKKTQSELSEYNMLLSSKKEAIGLLEQKAKTLEADITTNQEELASLKHQISVLVDDLKNRENILNGLNRQISEAKKLLSDIRITSEEEVELLKTTIDTIAKEHLKKYPWMEWSEVNKKMNELRPGFKEEKAAQRKEKRFENFLRHNPDVRAKFNKFQQQKEKNRPSDHDNRG